MTQLSADDMNAFFKKAFEGRPLPWPKIVIAEPDFVRIELEAGPAQLRPGGFINGPTQMGLADQVAYAVIFTRLGITPMAMTSNLNIDFLRPCQGDKLIAEGKMIKLGRSLALIEVNLRGNQNEKVSSRATVTYALPRK
jgi:uncharacterized protein (TIGR00369 family)